MKKMLLNSRTVPFGAVFLCIFALSAYQNCAEDVGFDARPSTIRTDGQGGAGDVDPLGPNDPRGPIVGGSSDVIIKVNQRPHDDILANDDSLVDFEVTTPIGSILSVTCELDGAAVACGPVDQVAITDPGLGEHTFIIVGSNDSGKRAVEVITWTIYNQVVELTKDITVNTVEDRVDIIINIDNSGSMEYEQGSMASRVATLMSKFEHLDYHISITTTSPIGGVWGSDLPYVDGRFVALSDGSHCIKKSVHSLVQAQAMIQESVVRDLYLRDSLGNTVLDTGGVPYPEGNGWERGIFTTYRVFERSNTPSNPEASCLRDGVAKHVILISDERETLTNNDGVLFVDVAKSSGVELRNYVASVFGPNIIFKFHSIIVNPYSPEGVACLASHGNKSGVEYANLSLATGGVIGSVCALDYASQLGEIGQTISDSNLSYPLACVAIPNGSDVGGVTDLSSGQPVNVGYRFSGDKIEFDQLLQAGSYRIRYFCYQ